MHLVTTVEMSEIDKRAQEEYAVPGLLLMEQAGVKGFHACINRLPDLMLDTAHMVFIAGSGNNGGDALVMAREACITGVSHVAILKIKEVCNDIVTLQRRMCTEYGIDIVDAASKAAEQLIDQADIIFDGMIGTGLRGELSDGALKEFIISINSLTRPAKIAVDLPSGLTDGVGKAAVFFHADMTITFGWPKQIFFYPHIRSHCGEIITINPGFPPDLLARYGNDCILQSIDEVSFPTIDASSYKNKKGHLSVFAGSSGFIGAAVLASEAALRVRTGLVTLFCDRSLYPIVAAHATSVMVKPVERGYSISSEVLRSRYDAVLVGPGWGVTKERALQLTEILHSGIPVVIDADAITLVRLMLDNGSLTTQDLHNVIMTPHPGEFLMISELYDKENPEKCLESIRAASKNLGCIILYKSHINYICSPEGNITVMEGMNPAMGTAGSGDVLSGIVGGLAAQDIPLMQAACMGNALHQKTGLITKDDRGWFVAEDLLSYIGIAIKELEGNDLLDHQCSLY